MERGEDLADWHARVLSEAHLINDSLHPPLSSRALQGTAQRVADWIWRRFAYDYDQIQGKHVSSKAKRMGLASGVSRRRGTPLEHDREPWSTLGITHYLYYRYFRFADERPEDPKPPPRPWIELGITNAAFRQRVCRARAGTYPGANQGRPPWDYVQISGEIWRGHYAREPQSDGDCHAFQTEPLIAPGADPDPSLATCCDVEPAASDEEGRPGSDEQPRARGKRLVDYAIAAAIDEYLSMRDPAHFADLKRLGLPQYQLRRPMPPIDDYNPHDPAHRKLYAMARGGVERRNRRVAAIIHAEEARLGLAPSVPPWVAVQGQIGPEVDAWDGSLTPFRQLAYRARGLGRGLVAEQYPPAAHLERPADAWPRFLSSCCGADCGVSLVPPQILCHNCLALALKRVPCSNCGGETTAFSIAETGECMRCVSATSEEHTARTNTNLRAWLQFQIEHQVAV